MSVELKLTDKELPVSPAFVDFMSHVIEGRPFEAREWSEQLSETLSDAQREMTARAQQEAAKVIADERGRAAIMRVYQWLLAMLTGDVQALGQIQLHYHFVNVIGIPRTGGSYLTTELYRALGYDPHKVPTALAHDGFPEAGPFLIRKGENSWIVSLQTMAEYLVMVEMYFAQAKRHSGKIVVPKKLTKGIYAGGFFQRVLGRTVEHVFTVRHPVTACVSTYEKSGGLPGNGRFAIRSNIEEWILRDLVYTGRQQQELAQMDYFEAYLRYWELYHLYIATTGLSATPDLRVIAYGKGRFERLAASFHRRYESDLEIPEFKVRDEPRQRHPDWTARAEPVVRRVADVWSRVGILFPYEEVMEGW